MVLTMLIEKYFLKNNTYNTAIITDLSFTLLHTNSAKPVKLFHLYNLNSDREDFLFFFSISFLLLN